jgi:hypothetical protein
MKSKTKGGESVACWTFREKMRTPDPARSVRAGRSLEDEKLRVFVA